MFFWGGWRVCACTRMLCVCETSPFYPPNQKKKGDDESSHRQHFLFTPKHFIHIYIHTQDAAAAAGGWTRRALAMGQTYANNGFTWWANAGAEYNGGGNLQVGDLGCWFCCWEGGRGGEVGGMVVI